MSAPLKWVVGSVLIASVLLFISDVNLKRYREDIYSLRKVYRSLERQKLSLEKRSRLLESELELASSGSPYLVIDTLSEKLKLKLQGAVLIEWYALSVQVESRLQEGAELPTERLFVLQGKEVGAAPEQILEELDADTLSSALQELKVESSTVQTPTSYILYFDHELKVYLRSDGTIPLEATKAKLQLIDRMVDINHFIRNSFWESLSFYPPAGDRLPHRIYITLDENDLRAVFRSISIGIEAVVYM